MEYSMFTRLTWTTFQPEFARAAIEIFELEDAEAFNIRFEKSFRKILRDLPEVSLNGSDSVLRLMAVIMLACVKSLEKKCSTRQLDLLYESATHPYEVAPGNYRQLPFDLIHPHYLPASAN